VILWAFFVNIGQTLYKGVLGVLSGSAALIADSMHSGADVVASGVTMASVRLSGRPANEKYPYGYGNIQFISSSIVGIILITGALYLIYESVVKIMNGDVAAPSAIALLGAAVSVVTNELMYRYQSCVGKENNSPAIIANAWDNRSDALSSLAVLVGIAFAVLGFPIADNLAAIAVGFMVAKIGIELNIDAIGGLMDSSVEVDVLSEVFGIAKATPQVLDVYYLRGRNVGEDVHLEVSICVDGALKMYESDFIVEAVRKRIFDNIDHVTDVQISVVPTYEETKGKGWFRKSKLVPIVPE
jgi:cation diffusion facilitator family transporter